VASGALVQPADLGMAEKAAANLATDAGDATLETVERRHIAAVLDRTQFNITHAARILDIDRVTLYNKIKKYHLREREPA
jgi:DNA-binding NtrC family response regulator